MKSLTDSFEILLGRRPEDSEVQELYRVRDALELHNNDALWLVLMALQHYQWLYQKMPESIAEASKKILGDIKESADATMRASKEKAKVEMSEIIAKTASGIADIVKNSSADMLSEIRAGANKAMKGVAQATETEVQEGVRRASSDLAKAAEKAASATAALKDIADTVRNTVSWESFKLFAVVIVAFGLAVGASYLWIRNYKTDLVAVQQQIREAEKLKADLVSEILTPFEDGTEGIVLPMGMTVIKSGQMKPGVYSGRYGVVIKRD